MPRTKVEVKVDEEASHSVSDVMKLLDVTANVSDAQRRFKLAGATTDIEARESTVVSTGMLCTDLLLNGGIYPGGWYSFNGPEGSCKSTSMMTAFVSFYYSDVPLVVYMDPENSSDPKYIETIARTSNPKGEIDIKKAFGIRDPKNSEKWVIEPRIQYSPEDSLESIWKSIASMLRKLPDKVFVDGKWWLLFENSKVNISRFKGKGNTKIGNRFGRIAIESLDGGRAQALFVVDSIASMVSEADEEEEGTNALGLEARGHSKQGKKVRGKLKRKHSTVIVTNQIRDKPMAKAWEKPTYSPGGNWVKHAADVRLDQNPRAVPHAKGQLEEEDSVQFPKGSDTYRYICIRSDKNKYGTPYLEMWYRLWLRDPQGNGHGLCPVYDTFKYLELTGQIDGSFGTKFSIKLGDLELPKMKFLDFKRLILLQGDDLKEACQELGIKRNPRLRERCFEQIAKGDGRDRYYATLHGLNEDEEEEWNYEDMSDKELIADIVERDLLARKDARKLDREAMIELLEENDAE